MAIAEKLKKIIKSRAFLFKLVLTILLFVFIPLLTMQIYLISHSTEEFRKTNQQYYFSVLQASTHTFTSRQQALSQTALRIGMNEDIQRPLRHNATEYAWYEAAQALNGYGAEILNVEKAGVYYVSKGCLLVNGFKYTLKDYCEMIEPSDPEQAQKMEAFFKNLEGIEYFATSDGNDLYVARPITLGLTEDNDGIAFFIMDAKALEESFRVTVTLHSSFGLVNDRGDFLLKGEDFKETIDPVALSNFLSSKSNLCAAGDEQLLVYKYQEPQTGYTFLLSVNKDESQEQLLAFIQQVRVTMFVIIVLMVIVIIVTIYINYRPIRQLSDKYVTTHDDDELYSEIERLDSAFFKLDEESSTQRQLLVNFILGDLLHGNEIKPELLNRYFPAERYQSFAVLTVLCPALTTEQSAHLADLITEVTGDSIYVTSVSSRPHMVIICLSETNIDSEALRCSTAEAIKMICGTGYEPHVGKVVSEIGNLRASYRSAITANLETVQAITGDNAEEFTKKLQTLSQCVYVGDEAEAQKQLENIKSFLYTQTVGEGHRRYYCFELLHSYLAVVNSGKPQLSNQEAELLLSFNGTEHLFKLLHESIAQTCNRVADTERTVNLQLQQQLLQYVEEHYTSSELSLSTAANHLGTSIYVVSRLFKELTGKGFKDYVTEKRLEYGHALLITSQKSIAEISAESGFDSSSYFSIVFKQKYGVPPSKYRSVQKTK